MEKLFAIITLVLFILTIGCGLAINFGGETFRDGIKGHLVLGILTFVSFLILFILIILR